MGEFELHIACRRCGRVAVLPAGRVTPFEYHRLKCSHCGARDPQVDERERIVPFSPGYVPNTPTRLKPR